MSKYSELIKSLKEFCDSMHCDLIIRHYSKYQVCFKAIADGKEEWDDNPFAVSIYYPEEHKIEKDANGKTIRTVIVSPQRIVHFDICSCYDEYSGGQFTRKQIELLLALDDLTDEELCIETPKKEEIPND